MSYEINVDKIKIASAKEDFSKTIEELLELNKRITKRIGKEVLDLTEKQLDSDDYTNKKSRGEQDAVTEKQFDHKENKEEGVVETRLQKAPKNKQGHNPDASSDKEVGGLKHVGPIWYQVNKNIQRRK